jgi:hypothetical protein
MMKQDTSRNMGGLQAGNLSAERPVVMGSDVQEDGE